MPAKLTRIRLIVKKVLWSLLALGLAYTIVLTAVVVWLFEYKLRRWPVFVQAAPYSFRVGDDIVKTQLLERLGRLGYNSAQSAVPDPGEWNHSGAGLNINVRHSPFTDLGMVSGPITLSMDWNRIRSIRLMRSAENVNEVTLEPELIHIIPVDGVSPELCRSAPLDKIPSLLVEAIVLTEDVRFHSHQGIDIDSIGQALVTNVKAGRYVQGGSTIPQQLMRMTLLSPEKTLGRKINEVALAVIADALYSKSTILEAYLNRVYFGHWGPFPVKGVKEAARLFFGKDLKQIDPAECALLAAIIRAPNVIHPYRHPERALGRRNVVLGLMMKSGKISRDEYEEAIGSPIKMRRPGAAPVRASAFVDLVKDGLTRDLNGSQGSHAHPDVITSLDPLLQVKAEALVKTLGEAGAQAHVIIAGPHTGDLKAFVAPGHGKWDGAGGNLETFLPFMVIPGLLAEKRDDPQFTLTSQVFLPNRVDSAVTFREAFSSERGFLVQKLLTSLSSDRVAKVLNDFGIRTVTKGDEKPSVGALTPFEVAQCYATLAALGNSKPLAPAISPSDRRTGEATSSARRVSIKPSVLFLVNHLMKDLSPGSTREGDQEKTLSRPSVWTAKDKQGLWAVAYTSDLLVVARVPGRSVSEKVLRGKVFGVLHDGEHGRSAPVPVPDGVVFQKICVQTGLRATSVCPKVIREPFLKGTQPTEWCPSRHDAGGLVLETGKPPQGPVRP